MPDEKKRMIENYEVKTAIHINKKEIVFAEDIKAEYPFMVTDVRWDNPLNFDVYEASNIYDSYLEAMGEFSKRLEKEVEILNTEREKRGVPEVSLSEKDCIDKSQYGNYKGQLIVIKPEKIANYARTADNQLLFATGGNGCYPNSSGRAVFCTNLFTGKSARWNREDVAGVIDPDKTPAWANEKLAALQDKQDIEKESINSQLTQGKKIAKAVPLSERKDVIKTDPLL